MTSRRFTKGTRRDVVVIGGRVAGSATAMLLARLGHDVLVVDRGEPATDTLSTHALVRSGVLQLKRWNVLEDVRKRATPAIRRITLGFGDQSVAFDVANEHGIGALYAPRRSVLDGELLEAAEAANVEFRLHARMVDLTRDETGRVDGVVIKSGGQTEILPTRLVVGADGMHSRVARNVGARDSRRHPPLNSIIYSYFQGLDVDGYEFQFTPGFNVGFVPTNDGLVNVFAAQAKGTIAGQTEDVFEAILESASPEMSARVHTARRVEPFRKTTGIPGFLRDPFGSGWVLVGDAGFTKDPISAHGISDALRDAELAANAIHRALEGEPSSENAHLAQYQKTRDRFAIPLYEEAKALAEYRWTAEEASAHLRRLAEITDAECRHLAGLSKPSLTAA